MLYGLYLSATGVMTSSYRQDVIANNLANSETTGFKRDLALFQERSTEAQANPIDVHQGELEPSTNPLDVALVGRGYFAVQGQDGMKLTRDGQFMADRAGRLMLTNGDGGQRVLD